MANNTTTHSTQERERQTGDNDSRRDSAAPSREEVAQRAYDLYRARGGEDGHDMDDWLEAERELQPK